MSEAAIERAIGDYLFYMGFCFYKQNTRGFLTMKEKKGVMKAQFRKDVNPYCLTGLPDYVVIYRGMHQGLEVKKPGGTQQANQKEFAFYLKQKGGAHYAVVHSVEETKSILEEFKKEVDRIFRVAENILH